MNSLKNIMKKTALAAEQAATEGIVLLKNENGVLPLAKNAKIAVFGRCQIDYNPGGTGSGGSVNTEYILNILDSLEENPSINVNKELAKIYRKWVKKNPVETGKGEWASRPLFQEEMPVSRKLAERIAKKSPIAVVIMGRTAGEEQDSKNQEGGYLLTASEKSMLKTIRKHFEKVVVLLNVPAVIETAWVDELGIDGLLYIWQGGQQGGKGAASILCGDQCPSGRLTDTVAYNYSDYPSSKNFGNPEKNIYEEDIYVGYRYFETFDKDKAMYPFGFGLSYTEFKIKASDFKADGREITFKVSVKNTGGAPGKEVVQVYFSPPSGKINKPKIQLAEFAKTELLAPGDTQELTFKIPMSRLSVYDDRRLCCCVEKGLYKILIGKNVRDKDFCRFSFNIDKTIVIRSFESALAPTESFKRMCGEKGKPALEKAPTRKYDLNKRIKDQIPKGIEQTGDRGYKLKDVKSGKVTMKDFLAQLSEEDLACLVRGEGMRSKRVRPGTGTAFGGISKSLIRLGIPTAAGTDGPSGLRFDNGDNATLVPIGTMLASTWNKELVQEIYSCIGDEMLKNDVDLLLGPGLNIHRNPLCGRNFEYFSEDPYVSGAMAAAAIRGLNSRGVSGTLKHLVANNQEANRKTVNSVVSERAVREIYLRALEYATELSEPNAIMTAYNPLNGNWCGSNFDLVKIIRNEFGFKGVIMTDWWAMLNDTDVQNPTKENTAAMLRSGTDIYMVSKDPENNSGGDNTLKALAEGSLTLGELQRAAENILSFILTLPCMETKKEFPCIFRKISKPFGKGR